ncbi:RNA polymerase sigma factor, partial [Acinetobacter baumannii]
MINTAIDHYRKYRKHQLMIDQNEHKTETLAYNGETSLDKISYDEILKAIKNLSPAYRTVFNLFVIDGLSHEEISKQLNISVGT